MSRKSTLEYLGQMRRRYAGLKTKVRRSGLLDEFCSVTGYERKYANKLLTGNRLFREHAGRGRTYTDKALELVERMWRRLGCICPQYLAARIDRHLDEFKEVCHVPDGLDALIRGMSASTIARSLRGKPRESPGSLRKAYAHPSRSPQFAFVEVRSGELELASTVAPGDVQVDTVALCGGDMSGDFFWILVLVDRRTQWVEFRPVWNRGAAGVFAALEAMLGSFPFPVRSLHCDNGREFINAHLTRFARRHPGMSYARSRTGKCNDNAHVEEKNGAVVRGVFGETRYGNADVGDELWDFCESWSRYVNLCRCSVQLVSRVKRAKAKGYRKTYDGPMTPAERAAAFLDGPAAERLRARSGKLNGIVERERLIYKLNRIRRKLDPRQREATPVSDAPSRLAASRRPSGDALTGHPRHNGPKDGKCPAFDASPQ